MSKNTRRITIGTIGLLLMATALYGGFSRGFSDYAGTLHRYTFVLESIDTFEEQGVISLPSDEGELENSRSKLWRMAEDAHQLTQHRGGPSIIILCILSLGLIAIALWPDRVLKKVTVE